MKRTMAALAAGLAFAATGLAKTDPAGSWCGGRMSVGCNYWASHAGMYMWRNWNAQQVEKDLDLLAAHGMTMLRVFPLWPDFQPLTAEYGIRGRFHGYRQDGRPFANPACVDEEMMGRFRFLCDAAEKCGIRLVVGLVTGWMSARLFVPPALETKNVLTDPEAVKWEVRFVRHFVREMKGHRAIAAWDLGNEIDCMGEGEEPQLWNWIFAISSAIRLEDATRPVVSGLHGVSSLETKRVNARQHAELLDVMTTHPYPLFTPNCNTAPFNTMRNGCHAACETVYYADMTGKPAFVEEAGSLGPSIASEEHAAATMRASLFSSWANGISAYLWWCGFNQDRLDFAPYRWTAIERELGLFTADGEPKPTAIAMRDFAAFLKSLPFDTLPARRKDAVVVLSETRDDWKKAQGAWLLGRRAGIDVAYALAEGDELPSAPLYVLSSCGGSMEYTREAYWRVLRKAQEGATVLITLGNGSILSNLREVAGVKTEDFFQIGSDVAVTVDGVRFSVREPSTRLLAAEGAQVVAADQNGRPALTVKPYGRGKVVFFNAAIELNAQDTAWPVYRFAAREAGIRRLVEATGDVRTVGFTEHPCKDGKVLVVAVNYAPEKTVCPVRVDGKVSRIWNGRLADGRLEIAPNDGCVFELTPEGR